MNIKKDILRLDEFKNSSGEIFKKSKIPILKTKNYFLYDRELDGNAPKWFIKAYFYEKNSKVRKVKIGTWKYFIAKASEKWYPHESVIEYMINLFGLEIGLNLNNVKLCLINEQIIFLSEYFINSKNEELIHGAQIFGEYFGNQNEDIEFAKEIANNKRDSREFFTIEFIFRALDSVFSNNDEIKRDFVKMLVFDALVGNNDRHFYNWGIISRIDKDLDVRFSPIYDTARAFLWNWSDDKIKLSLKDMKKNGKKIDNYIEKASPRVSIEGDKNINHFKLIEFIWNQYFIYREIITDLACIENENKIIDLFNREFSHFFIKERNELIIYIIKTRFEKIRNICK